MKIASVLENQQIEKRIAITPEIAKKYISLGFEILLSKDYGVHIGISDETYKKIGVNISNDEKEILSEANIIVQVKNNRQLNRLMRKITKLKNIDYVERVGR